MGSRVSEVTRKMGLRERESFGGLREMSVCALEENET